MTEVATPPQPDKPDRATVTLATPIERGDTKIETLDLRKPRAGELRGLSLQDILTSEVVALLTLIPRITNPPLNADEADNLDPADLAEIGGSIRGFFMTRAERDVIERMIGDQRPRS
ncbi:phage tail assembly protein [Pelagerythrobacter sp.]|uniref:phage tail assembly protein n=1 Tax=Pelagerythrobacter sp. TaxID=2800702 RepID=UPI0035AD7D93